MCQLKVNNKFWRDRVNNYVLGFIIISHENFLFRCWGIKFANFILFVYQIVKKATMVYYTCTSLDKTLLNHIKINLSVSINDYSSIHIVKKKKINCSILCFYYLNLSCAQLCSSDRFHIRTGQSNLSIDWCFLRQSRNT